MSVASRRWRTDEACHGLRGTARRRPPRFRHKHPGNQYGETIMSTSASAAARLLEAGDGAIDQATALLKALANENRLRILCLLDGRELSVTELNRRLSLSQSALSQHLAILRREGLVTTRRASQTIYYSLQGEQAGQMVEALTHLQQL